MGFPILKNKIVKVWYQHFFSFQRSLFSIARDNKTINEKCQGNQIRAGTAPMQSNNLSEFIILRFRSETSLWITLSLCTWSTDNLKRVYILLCHKWSQISRSQFFQTQMSSNCCLSINYSVHFLQHSSLRITQCQFLYFYLTFLPDLITRDMTELLSE